MMLGRMIHCLTLLVATASLIITVSKSHAAQCPANSHVERIEQSGNVRKVHCKCNEGFSNRGGACRSNGIISEKEKKSLKDDISDRIPTRESDKIYWARPKSRNDCNKAFYDRVKSDILLGARPRITTMMAHTDVYYAECINNKPMDVPGTEACGFEYLYSRCYAGYQRSRPDGEEAALKSFVSCYRAFVDGIHPEKTVCFHQ